MYQISLGPGAPLFLVARFGKANVYIGRSTVVQPSGVTAAGSLQDGASGVSSPSSSPCSSPCSSPAFPCVGVALCGGFDAGKSSARTAPDASWVGSADDAHPEAHAATIVTI